MALSLEDITFCMQKIELDKEKYNALVQELEAAEEEKKAARESGKKKSKYKLTVLVRGDQELADKLQQAWVVKTPEEMDDNLIVGKLQEAAGSHNAASSRKKNYITLWSDLFASLKRRFSKDVGVNIQTKEPVRVLVLTDENVGEVPVA